MAYKFQLGSAILSGSTKFEEAVEVAGGLKLSGVDDTALDVSADSFLFRDADGTMKRDTMADYATAIAGDGLAASSGVLAVGVDDSSIELNSDALRIKAEGVTDAMLNDDVATGLAGVGLAAASGVLTLDIDEFGALGGATVAQGDNLLISDGGTEKKVTFSNFEDSIFGNVSGDATIAAGGALTIAANAVEDSMVNDNVATGLAGVGLGASGGVLAVQVSGAVKISSDKVGLSGSIAGDGLKYLGGADSISTLEVDLNELPAAVVAVASDSIAIIDSDDNGSKKESIADFVAAIASTAAGMQAASGQLGVNLGGTGGLKVDSNAIVMDVSNLSTAAINVANDTFAFKDADDDETKQESIADLMTAVAGDGLAASSGVLAVQVSGAVKVTSDKLGLSGSIAGLGLGFEGGADSISSLELDLNELGAATIAVDADSFAFIDATDNTTKKESIADLITAVAGNGLSAASGVLALDVSEVADASVASGDKFVFEDGDNSTKKESIDDIATFMAGSGNGLAASSGVLSLEIDGLSALGGATVAQADNFLLSDDGTEKKVTFSNLEDTIFGNVSGDATVAAGGALTIAADAVESGMLNDNVISGQTDIGAAVADTDELLISDGGSLRRTDVSRLRAMAVASKADGDTLVGGLNYFGDLSSDATVSLPASPEIGDKVVVKAKGLSSAVILINRQGSHTIDGETSVTIESPFGAVTCVYVAANDWRLI